jgi:DNA-binding GntR family transcriptional regulator
LPKNLSDIAYNALRSEILRCEITPGSQLVESHIAQRYGISRTPVREALKRLMQDGLIESSPRRGYSVTPVTIRDLQEVFSLRIILEGEAAALATPRVSNRRLDELDELLSSMLRKQDQSFVDNSERMAYISDNTRFHKLIAEASGNLHLVSIVTHLIDEAVRFIYLETGVVGKKGIEESYGIVSAMRAGDTERARQTMGNHIQATYERALQVVLSGFKIGDIALMPRSSDGCEPLE